MPGPVRQFVAEVTLTCGVVGVGDNDGVGVEDGTSVKGGVDVKTGVLLDCIRMRAWAVIVPARSGGCAGFWPAGRLQARMATNSALTASNMRLALIAFSSPSIVRRCEPPNRAGRDQFAVASNQ